MNPDTTAQNPEEQKQPETSVPQGSNVESAPDIQPEVPVAVPSPQTEKVEAPKATITDLQPSSDGAAKEKENKPVKEKKPRKPFKIALILVPILVILGLGLGSAFFVVYGQASFIPFELKVAVSSVILKVPFLPKTKEYILVTAANVNKDTRSAKVDATLGVTSQAIEDFVEATSADFSIDGVFDFNDNANSRADFSVSLGEYMSFDFRSLPENSYFQITKLNPSLITFLSVLEDEDLLGVLNVWVEVEKSVTTVVEDKVEEQEEKGFTKDEFISFLKEDVVPALQMSHENPESFVLSLTIDQALVEKLMSRMDTEYVSDDTLVQDGTLEVVVDSKTYLVKQISFSTSFNPYVPSVGLPEVDVLEDSVTEGADVGSEVVLGESASTEVQLLLVANISEHGASFEVTAPSESITVDEYVNRLTDVLTVIIMKTYGGEDDDFDIGMTYESPELEIEVNTGDENTPFGKMLP